MKSTGCARKYTMKICEECGHMIRQIRYFKGKYYCYNCYMKHAKKMSEYGEFFEPPAIKTLDEALNKIRIVRGYINNRGTLYANISLPSVLVGKKIKLILVEDEK